MSVPPFYTKTNLIVLDCCYNLYRIYPAPFFEDSYKHKQAYFSTELELDIPNYVDISDGASGTNLRSFVQVVRADIKLSKEEALS